MNKARSIQLSNSILSEFKIPATKENIDTLLDILKSYSVLKVDKFADYECEGQMEIEEFLDKEKETDYER